MINSHIVGCVGGQGDGAIQQGVGAWSGDRDCRWRGVDLNELAVHGLGVADLVVRPVLDCRRRGDREGSIVDGAVRQAGVSAISCIANGGDARAASIVGCRKVDRDRPVVVARAAGAAVAGDGTRRGGRVDLEQRCVDRLGIASVVVRPVLDRRRRGDREGSAVDGAVGRTRVGSVGRVDDLGDARAASIVGCRKVDRDRPVVVARVAGAAVAGDGTRRGGRVDLEQRCVDRLGIASVVVRPVLDRRRRGDREGSAVDGAVGRTRVGSVGRVDDLGDARAARVIYS